MESERIETETLREVTPVRKPEAEARQQPLRHIADSELERWFGFQTATGAAAELHVDVRQSFLHMALFLNDILPEGPNKTLALRHLEDAAHRANKAVALDPAIH